MFTTSTNSIGNKSLTYPVGIPSADELIYSGLTVGAYANTTVANYTFTGRLYWTMTPGAYYATRESFGPAGSCVRAGGETFGVDMAMNYDNFAKPVINLKSIIKWVSGDGSISNPYRVEL